MFIGYESEEPVVFLTRLTSCHLIAKNKSKNTGYCIITTIILIKYDLEIENGEIFIFNRS